MSRESLSENSNNYNKINKVNIKKDLSSKFFVSFSNIALESNQSNAWDAWRWRKSMWLAIHDGAYYPWGIIP